MILESRIEDEPPDDGLVPVWMLDHKRAAAQLVRAEALHGSADDHVTVSELRGAVAAAQLYTTSTAPDVDGDGVADYVDVCQGQDDRLDSDGDGFPDCLDNCPETANPGQEDADGDGIGDVCDNCPDTANADQTDANGNGVGDACDDSGRVMPTDCGAGLCGAGTLGILLLTLLSLYSVKLRLARKLRSGSTDR